MGCTSSQPAAAAAPPPPPVPEEFVAEMQQKVKQTVRRSSMWENDDDDAAADLARLCNEIKVDQRPDDAGGGSDTASGTEPDDDNEIAVMTKARLQMEHRKVQARARAVCLAATQQAQGSVAAGKRQAFDASDPHKQPPAAGTIGAGCALGRVRVGSLRACAEEASPDCRWKIDSTLNF